MKKAIISVMWLAIASVFTITTLSACSDDDNENKKANGAGVTIYGVDQVEYFRQFLGAFTETDNLSCPFSMKVIDKLTPTVYSYFVEDEKEAEKLFLAWIPQEARDAVLRDGNTIVYTPRDAQGAEQGTITFRAALPSETATFAVVEFKDVSKIKGIDKIKFQPESANPNNAVFDDIYLPPSINTSQGDAGTWFWGQVPKNDISVYHHQEAGLLYVNALPKLITGKEFIEKIGEKTYTGFAFESFCNGTRLHDKFRYKVYDYFKPDGHRIITEAFFDYETASLKIQTAEIRIDNDIKVYPSDPMDYEYIDESEQYWVCQGYIFRQYSGWSKSH